MVELLSCSVKIGIELILLGGCNFDLLGEGGKRNLESGFVEFKSKDQHYRLQIRAKISPEYSAKWFRNFA